MATTSTCYGDFDRVSVGAERPVTGNLRGRAMWLVVARTETDGNLSHIDPEPPDELPKSSHCGEGKRTIEGLNCLPGPPQGILAERL